MAPDFKKHSEELKQTLSHLDEFHKQILTVAEVLQTAFTNGKTVYVAGNGGSASQAQHLSDEMVGRYKADRAPFPVVALTADGAVLTCIGNDYGYEHVFSRQLLALGKEGDVFIGLSTSGESKNILKACEQALESGMTIVALTGPKGSLKDKADYAIVAPVETTARMQELHLHAIHLLCEVFEPSSH
jgi:D-sedoheptulose 7-phosphate isomerase